MMCSLSFSFATLVAFAFVTHSHTYYISKISVALSGQARVRVAASCLNLAPYVVVDHITMATSDREIHVAVHSSSEDYFLFLSILRTIHPSILTHVVVHVSNVLFSGFTSKANALIAAYFV